MEIEIHPLQAEILRKLLFTPNLRFSDLNDADITSDHFSFHVKRLIELDLISKDEKNYVLTSKGKEFANRFDTDTNEIEKQAKIGVLVSCVREGKSGKEFLMQQRLKEPYFGFWGFITGKIRSGDSVVDTAARELMEETGLTAKLKLAGIKHKTDLSDEGVLLEDKFFFIFRGSDVSGELVEDFEGGHNEWIPESKIEGLENLFDGVRTTLEIAKDTENLSFIEKKYNVERF